MIFRHQDLEYHGGAWLNLQSAGVETMILLSIILGRAHSHDVWCIVYDLAEGVYEYYTPEYIMNGCFHAVGLERRLLE